jgi:hypothetical protein
MEAVPHGKSWVGVGYGMGKTVAKAKKQAFVMARKNLSNSQNWDECGCRVLDFYTVNDGNTNKSWQVID